MSRVSDETSDEPSTGQRKLTFPANSPAPKIRLMQYDDDELEECEIASAEEIRSYTESARTTWIDVQGLGDEAELRSLAGILGIHGAALEDAVDIPQRAKTQDYGDYLLVVIRAPLSPFAAGDNVPQVCILLAANHVITFQERYFAFFDDVRARVRDQHSMLRHSGPAHLVFGLVDSLIERYYPLSDEILDALDEIESRILEHPSPQLVARVHELQRQLTTLRRVARPQVDALYKLSHIDSPLVPDSSVLYLKDAEDRARQIMGRLDASREAATDLMNAVLATLGHRQNEIMKVLTLVGSIFLPLTFMAGIYGMNFEHMPELGFRAAYPLLLVGMVVVAVGMVFYFRHRGWIGRRDEDD